MAIDDSDEWGRLQIRGVSEPYLRAYTESEGRYPVSFFRGIRCDRGSDRFRLERAGSIVRRQYAACRSRSFTCRAAEDWEEPAEEGSEPYSRAECGGEQAYVGIGFAAYEEAPQLDAVKWFYVGVRCANWVSLRLLRRWQGGP